MGSCLCFCGVNHPKTLGICTGDAHCELDLSNFSQSSLIEEIFASVIIRMCKACREATLREKS